MELLSAFYSSFLSLKRLVLAQVWKGVLLEAIDNNRLKAFCQPILLISPHPSQRDNQLFEVLIRLIDKQGNVIKASRFIQLACCSPSLMWKLDCWVFKQVFSLPRKFHVCYHVNVSGSTISDPRFVNFLKHCLEQSDFLAPQIHLEITEQSLITNFTQINLVKKLGFVVGLDDFGSGYNSLICLAQIHPDFIKLDGVYSQNLKNQSYRAATKFVLQIAQELSIGLVAEWVDSEAIEQDLLSLKEEVAPNLRLYGQGYFYGEPAECFCTSGPKD
jgi:EAL domain-containing protein (putative c-di-GMP-specific phosphodiesterase class I)